MVPIRAIYNGVQQAAEPFELWTILEPMGEHPVYSTVSAETIAKHGRVPEVVTLTKEVSYVEDLGGFSDRATGKVSTGGAQDR